MTTGRRDAVAWAEQHRSYAETGVLVDDASVESDSKEDVKKA